MRHLFLAGLLPFLFSCATSAARTSVSITEFPLASLLKSSDLNPIVEAVRSKRIVMLGESMHMTREFSQVRNLLIQNLNHHSAHHLVFFEGSPIEFWIAEDRFLSSRRDEQSIADFQDTALFGLWQTPEIRALLSYGLASQRETSPSALYFTSYDVQIGQGHRYIQNRAPLFRELLKQLKKRGANGSKGDEKSILQLEGLLSCRQKRFPKDQPAYEGGLKAIQSLQDLVEKAKKESTMHDRFLAFLPQALRFSLDFCREANSGKRNYTEIRDEWAARQFQEILKEMQEKAIVWAHSRHVRQTVTTEGRGSFGASMRSLRPNEIFSISFCAKTGSALSFLDPQGNETTPYERPLLALENATFESKLSKQSSRDFFYLPKPKDGLLNEQEKARAEPDFVAPLRPYQDFDGYYLIQQVSPPLLGISP